MAAKRVVTESSVTPKKTKTPKDADRAVHCALGGAKFPQNPLLKPPFLDRSAFSNPFYQKSPRAHKIKLALPPPPPRKKKKIPPPKTRNFPFYQKSPRAHKLKLALPPPLQTKKDTPTYDEEFYEHGGFPGERTKIPVAHKIGAAISSPRLRAKKRRTLGFV